VAPPGQRFSTGAAHGTGGGAGAAAAKPEPLTQAGVLKEIGVAKLKGRKAMLKVFAESGGGGGGGGGGGRGGGGGAAAAAAVLVRQTTADGWATAAGKKAKPQLAGSTLVSPQRAGLPKQCKKYLDMLWRWKVFPPYSVHCACDPAFC
jgi:hypothetical protein